MASKDSFYDRGNSSIQVDFKDFYAKYLQVREIALHQGRSQVV